VKIPERQEFLDWLAREHLTEPERPEENGHARRAHEVTTDLSDEEIIELCRKAKNAAKFADLFDHGDTASHERDASRADLALMGMLAFYTDDPAQLERLFSRSALGRREKWTRRADYRRRTIGKVLSEPGRERYRSPRSERGSFSFSPPIYNNNENDPPKRPVAVRFSEMGPPEPRRYLVEGLIPEAYPTVLYGDGGVAKSMLALSASIAVARRAGRWLGRSVEGGPVLYVDFELDAQEQNRRVNRLARAEGLTSAPHDMLYLSGLGYTPRAAFGSALETCREHEVRLMILDSLGPALQGDAEAARDVIAFYQSVLEPFRAEGVTVVVVDHQSKLQAGERYQNKRAFGSVFKGNLARSVIQVEAKERFENRLSLLLRQVKHNFGPLADPFGVELSFTEELVTVEHKELEAAAMAEESTLNAADRVRYALKEGPAYPDDIVEATGLAAATVKSTLSKLRKAGEVEPTGERGKWGAEQVRLSFTSYKDNENENDLAPERLAEEF
jgi:hypothetical protein